MPRFLLVVVLVSTACSSSKSREEESQPPPRQPTPAAEAITEPAGESDAQVKPLAGLDSLRGEFQHLGRNPTDVGPVPGLFDVTGLPFHDVVVVDDYAYVVDGSGMLFRVGISGGEFEVLHDSGGGSGSHASSLTRAGNSVYYTVQDLGYSRDESQAKTTLHRIVDGASVPVTAGPEILELAGDGISLFATVFQENDIRVLRSEGFEPFAKARAPGSPLIVGEYLYWTSYNAGSVNRIHISGKKPQRLARAKRAIGLAVVADTVYYGTESDGAIHAVPSTGGPSRTLVAGFDNHDLLVADDAAVYFWTWGQPNAVLRLDVTSGKVEALITGLAAPRGLALYEGWLYVVAGGDLLRVRTDDRMTWPLAAD